MKREVTLTWAVLIAGVGCSDTNIYIPQHLREILPDNRIEVRGGFCAEGADSLSSFLKIMLIVDRSNSMNVTDPNNRRVTATQEAVMNFVEDPATGELRAGVEFAIIGFYGDVAVHTRDERGLPGFSRDGPLVLFSTTQLTRTGSNTGYDKALAQAFALLDRDMARLSDISRPRSRYEVVFLSDGMPYPDNCEGQENSPSAAKAAVERIKALESLHKVEIEVHTAFASDPRMFTPGNFVASEQCQGSGEVVDTEVVGSASIGDATRDVLKLMAEAGGGTFKQFRNGDAITFLDFEFAESRRIFALSNFLVANLNARPALDRVAADSDGDGLSDETELLIGSSLFERDSDGDGLSDTIEWRFRASGFDPLDPSDGQCADYDRQDSDGDGLADCEEAFLGTLRRRFDSDMDGLPDTVELSFGTNAASADPLQDALSDADADGGSNASELLWHTDPTTDDVAFRSSLAYDYQQRELPVVKGQACYEFTVRNIALASVRTPPPEHAPGGRKAPEGWNQVMLYFAQRPYDDPLGEPIYRVACVRARFLEERDLKLPPIGEVEIPMHRPSDTYSPAPVLRPPSHRCDVSVNHDCGLNALWCRFEDDGTCGCYRPPRVLGDPENGTFVGPCPACANGVDDDHDGLTDFPFDPDCFDTMDPNEARQEACSNGLDDDGDGLTDYPFDPGCQGAYDLDEADPATPPACSDGIDNDENGTLDYPNDAGCYAASDEQEHSSLLSAAAACNDGVDNDGDGLIDFGEDDGCFDPYDLDEDGPAVCFFCQRYDEALPGQCDIRSGYCRARSGEPSVGPCTSPTDCRGAPCHEGLCQPCIANEDCDSAPGTGDGLCQQAQGWCLEDAMVPVGCHRDADCGLENAPSGVCDADLGVCAVDPFLACRNDRDCRPGEICSSEYGFCLTPVFWTGQCSFENPACVQGRCDEEAGWCLPAQESEQCHHDEQCPWGDCRAAGYCEQQTFVFPTQFRSEVDCVGPR